MGRDLLGDRRRRGHRVLGLAEDAFPVGATDWMRDQPLRSWAIAIAVVLAVLTAALLRGELLRTRVPPREVTLGRKRHASTGAGGTGAR